MSVHRIWRRFSTWKSERGFTFPEVLVSLALLGALSLIVFAAFFTGDRTLRKVSAEISRNSELLEISSTLRSFAQRVCLPYWSADPAAAGVKDALSVPYVDGSKDRLLNVSFQNRTLTVGDGIQTVSFADVAEAHVELSSPAQGAAPAVLLTLRLADGDPLRIVAPLGGVPFPLVAP